MTPFFGWFSRRNGATPVSDSAATELLERARALVREGKQQEASDLYWKIKRKQRTVESLLEHAHLLLDLGDYFGAVSMASDALEIEPGNVKAEAVRRRVQQLEEAERRR